MIIKELFIRCRKLIISLAFITQPYFSVPKEVGLNSTHHLIMKVHNKPADFDYQDFMKIYRKCTSKAFFVDF